MTTQKDRLIKWLLVCSIVIALGAIVLVLCLLIIKRYEQPDALSPAESTAETTEKKNSLSVIMPAVPLITPNRFSPEDFAYNEQGYLTCISEPCLMGIDVSSYQENIDWNKVKEAGFSFVMIRVGGRSYGQSGKLYEDKLCHTHYQGAKEAGLLVGAYMFSQAVNKQEAAEEAYFALDQVIDWELDLPLVFDWEYIDDEKRTAYIYEDVVTECVKTFCDIVRECGKEPMVYVSPWFGRMNLEELEDYQHWLALYKDQMDYAHHFDMWQYTSSGSVPGISGPVDIDIYFPPYE